MRKIISSLVLIVLGAITIFQATSAVFEESVMVAGTSFSVGVPSGSDPSTPIDTNTALKMFVNLSGDSVSSNLADSLAGPSFGNINSAWSDEVAIKIHNAGSVPMNLVSTVNYVNDPNTLRNRINAEVIEWNDFNNNGQVDQGELGQSYGYDTILRWRNDLFHMGRINPDQTRGFVIKFDGAGLTQTNVGQSAIYDFVFKGVETE